MSLRPVTGIALPYFYQYNQQIVQELQVEECSVALFCN
jgi:hypothetical protein